MKDTPKDHVEGLLRADAGRLHAPPNTARVRRALRHIEEDERPVVSSSIVSFLAPIRPWVIAASVLIATITGALMLRHATITPGARPESAHAPIGLASSIKATAEAIKQVRLPALPTDPSAPSRRLVALAKPDVLLVGLRDALNDHARATARLTFAEPVRVLRRIADAMPKPDTAQPPIDASPGA